MLQINFIRENVDTVKAGLAKKHFKNIVAVDELLQLDEEKRKAQVETENNAAESNLLAKKIGELMKAGNKTEAESIKARTVELK
jgi:seryl-tRNA synthetase